MCVCTFIYLCGKTFFILMCVCVPAVSIQTDIEDVYINIEEVTEGGSYLNPLRVRILIYFYNFFLKSHLIVKHLAVGQYQ